MSAPTRVVDVPVDGGTLAVGVWEPDRDERADGPPPVVVAAHGITSSHVFWALVGQRLAAEGIALWAPDLRGRGASAEVPGASIGQHGADLLAVARHAGATGPVVLAGHSMGGFVAATAGRRHPEEVASLVLVDGGPPLTDPLPPDADVEAVLTGVVGQALARLDEHFPDVEAAVAFWRSHPSMAGVPEDLLAAYAAWDLRPDGDGWRCRVDRASVMADARDTLVSAEVLTAVAEATVPVHLLVAERGMLDGPEPLYPEVAVATVCDTNPAVQVSRVADTNHYTIGLSRHGADAVTAAIHAAVAAHTPTAGAAHTPTAGAAPGGALAAHDRKDRP